MLEFRLKELWDTVDHFVLVEATVSYVGNPKPLQFKENLERFEPYLSKIVHVIIDDMGVPEDPWDNDQRQHYSVLTGINTLDLADDDIIVISDLDEIPDTSVLRLLRERGVSTDVVQGLLMDLQYQNFTCRVEQPWDKPRVVSYGGFKRCKSDAMDIRKNDATQYILHGGWHLSYFFDAATIRNKIQNQAHQEANTPEITDIDGIRRRMQEGADLFGRREDVVKITRVDPETTTHLPVHWRWLEGVLQESGL